MVEQMKGKEIVQSVPTVRVVIRNPEGNILLLHLKSPDSKAAKFMELPVEKWTWGAARGKPNNDSKYRCERSC